MLALLLATVLMGATSAEVLDAARAAEADLDYKKARALITELLARSDAGPREKLEAHALAGQIERTAGDDAAARAHFLVVLRADSGWLLADDAPPKVRTFFELIRQDVVAEERAAAVVPVVVVDEPEAVKAPPVAGFVVGGVGAAVVVAGVATGIAGELMFADAGSAFDDRASGRTVALAGWSGVAVGVVVGVVGVGLLLAE